MTEPYAYPRIPNEEWRREAACSYSADPRLWDANVEGERAEEKARRHELAITICESCPVRVQCAASIDLRFDEGIRAGFSLPEKKQAKRPDKYRLGLAS